MPVILTSMIKDKEARLWARIRQAENAIDRDPDSPEAWDAYDLACDALDEHYSRKGA